MYSSSFSVYKTINIGGYPETFGAGFMNKSGRMVDFKGLLSKSYVIVYILKGRGTYIDAAGKEYYLSPGMFFQRIPELKHSNIIDPDSGWNEYFIEFNTSEYELFKKMGLINMNVPVYDIGINQGICLKIEQFIEDLRDNDESQLNLRSLKLIDIMKDFFGLALSMRKRDADDLMINKACKILTEDFAQKINIEDLCRKNGWGFEKFRKVFNERMGIAPGKYRMLRRLDMARSLLQERTRKVSEIADLLGYSSPYEFSAQFKRYTGISPSDFSKDSKL